MSRCSRCHYGFWAAVGEAGKMLWGCQYCLMTGERRPCPSGDQCAVYKPKKRRRFTKNWFEGR